MAREVIWSLMRLLVARNSPRSAACLAPARQQQDQHPADGGDEAGGAGEDLDRVPRQLGGQQSAVEQGCHRQQALDREDAALDRLMDGVQLQNGVGLNGHRVLPLVDEYLELGAAGRQLPAGVAAERVKGLLLLGGSRGEIGSLGAIGDAEGAPFRRNAAVGPEEIPDLLHQPAPLRHAGQVVLQTRVVPDGVKFNSFFGVFVFHGHLSSPKIRR